MYDRPFRWWVQSVMPLVFDDSLSYYEVLAKLTKYIEGLTGDVEQIEKILATIEGIGDVTQFTEFLERIQAEIGNLENLQTDTKVNLVSAINEIALKADIAYWKPPTGIPESDLSQEVQDKLNRTGEATQYIINNKMLKASPNNNSPADLGLGTYSVPADGIPWDTLSQDVRDRIDAGGGTGGTKDYTELINKPQINGHTLNAGDNTLENLGIGTYSKPSTGIPESDLSAEVQEKLNTSGGIADDEVSFVATREYNPGELVYINGTLYKVVYKILPGSNMIPGNNIVVTDISSEIERIDDELDSLQSGAGPDSWSLVANVTAQSTSTSTRFFEYFKAISGEDYLFIVTPDSSATSSSRYLINVNKKDGTVVYTETVDIYPENQQRFTFTPTDTGEYYCEIKKIFATDPNVSVAVELQYTASQGITELWESINEVSSVVDDVAALNDNVASLSYAVGHDHRIDGVTNVVNVLGGVRIAYANNAGHSYNTSRDTIDINNPAVTSSMYCGYAECTGGEILSIKSQGTASARPFAFINENGEVLRRGVQNVVDHQIEAPEGSAYVVFNCHYAYIEKFRVTIGVLNEKQDKLTFDSTPTENSNNPVTSGGVYDAINNANAGSDIIKFINYYENIYPIEMQNINMGYNTGTTIDINNPTAVNNINCAYVECVEGDRFTVYGRSTNSYRTYAFIDSSGNILEMADNVSSPTFFAIQAPKNSAYVVFNFYRGSTYDKYCITKGTPFITKENYGVYDYQGKNVAIIGDSLSTNGDYSASNPLGNVPEIVIGEADVGVTLSAYVTWWDVYTNEEGTNLTNKSIGGYTLQASDIGEELEFVPVEADIGKVVGKPKNNNAGSTVVWWEVAKKVLGFNAIPVCWSGSSMSSHQGSVPLYKTSYAWHDAQIRKCGIRTPGSMSRTAPDVIIVFRVGNDISHAPYSIITDYLDTYPCTLPDTDVVEEDGATKYDYVRATMLTIKKLREAYPLAKIILATMCYMRRIVDDWPTRNGRNTLVQYNQTVRDVANYALCDYIDFEKCGLNWANAIYDYYFEGTSPTAKWTHPNTRGHKLLGNRAVIDMQKVCDMT